MSTKNDDLPICLNCGSSVTDWNSDAEGHFCSHCHERVYLPEHLRFDGGNRAHRAALEIATGSPIPPGMIAMHECDNPPCVRVGPGHVILGTVTENNRDMCRKGRSGSQRRTRERRGQGQRYDVPPAAPTTPSYNGA